jgi:putative ABC transport system substrate-binding protein
MGHVGRRQFLIAGSALLATPFATKAQPTRKTKIYRIGTLTTAWAANQPSVEGLRRGLAALGMVEGRDVVFEHRFTEGNLNALPAAAASLIASDVDLIFTSGENATLRAAQATTTLPIVFANVGDPVASGVVRELRRPDGNVTGVSNLATDLAPKRIEILKELAPSLRRVWFIYDVADAPEARIAARNAADAAGVLKLEVLARPLRTREELRAVLSEIRPGDGILVYGGPTSLNISAEVLEIALRAGALTAFSSGFWSEHGALVAYGSDFYAVGYQAARQVAKVLAGTPPRDIPVEGANKIELVINAKVAKALGINIPSMVLLRADRVIE